MLAQRNHAGLNVLLFLLCLFCYMLWEGREIDSHGRSWEEVHIVLLLAALAGVGLRVYAWLRPETKEKSAGYGAALFLILVFFAEMTAAFLVVLLAGARAVLTRLESALSLPADKWFWFTVFVVFVAGAAPDPWVVGIGIVAVLVSASKYSEEYQRHERRSMLWPVFWGGIGLLLSVYYLYGQFINALPTCLPNEACTQYPYTFLQTRCRATCVLMHNFSKDLLFNIAAVVFAMIMMRGANCIAQVLYRIHRAENGA
ncbi:MAG: hypothetical protein HPY54_14540 [Chthonomonadetes bacterium]|nr:hypothetical protein [Chthonomonadetes bacterium]